MKNDVKDNNHCWVVIQSNRYILLIISILLLSLLEAQQGQYDRKSISSLGMIWHNGELKVVDENYKNLINSYIEVSRFDYNILPKRIVSHFYEKSINIDDLNEIESLLEETSLKQLTIFTLKSQSGNRGPNCGSIDNYSKFDALCLTALFGHKILLHKI